MRLGVSREPVKFSSSFRGAQSASPESISANAGVMDSGLAAARRSGMTSKHLQTPRVTGRIHAIALRRLRQRVLGLGIGPVEPERERFPVGALDGRAAPDTQARRGVAIGIDIEADAFLVERSRNPFDESRLRIRSEPGDRGVDDFQAYRR